MTVADIGAGTGLFTRLFSERVGAAGKVYALDISKVFVDNIVRISRELGQDNVENIVNAPDSVRATWSGHACVLNAASLPPAIRQQGEGETA
jgi:predicted methyltransferase